MGKIGEAYIEVKPKITKNDENKLKNQFKNVFSFSKNLANTIGKGFVFGNQGIGFLKQMNDLLGENKKLAEETLGILDNIGDLSANIGLNEKRTANLVGLFRSVGISSEVAQKAINYANLQGRKAVGGNLGKGDLDKLIASVLSSTANASPEDRARVFAKVFGARTGKELADLIGVDVLKQYSLVAGATPDQKAFQRAQKAKSQQELDAFFSEQKRLKAVSSQSSLNALVGINKQELINQEQKLGIGTNVSLADILKANQIGSQALVELKGAVMDVIGAISNFATGKTGVLGLLGDINNSIKNRVGKL